MEPSPKDQKYLRWANEGAKIFATCAKRQYMAIIVDRHGYVAGVGYNGVPSGFTHCIDGGCPRLNANSEPGTDYDNCLSIHAETNAMLNASSRDSMQGATLYVNGPPCFSCAKLVVNSGVERLVYTTDPNYVYHGLTKVEDLFKNAGVAMVHVTLEQ